MRESIRTEIAGATFEVMRTPQIVIQEEKGAQLFSLLLKAENPKWGETETPLSLETADYFRSNPPSPEIIGAIENLRAQGVDEETLYNLALTYQHPERAEKVLSIAEKYRPDLENPEKAHQKLLTLLEIFDQTFSNTPLAKKFATAAAGDIKERSVRLPETKKRIEDIIDFFKPDSKTTNLQRVSFTQTDPLRKKNSGRSFLAFPGEQIIISHLDNLDNQDHEFSHSIINPIVEKLFSQLTNEQKEKIARFAGEKLKQDYGGNYLNLLCEEFVRIYNDFVKEREKPQQYSGQPEKNELRDLILEIYQEYKIRTNSESVNFEHFVLSKFPTKI